VFAGARSSLVYQEAGVSSRIFRLSAGEGIEKLRKTFHRTGFRLRLGVGADA
jgi:hypothetical protein